MLHELRQGTWLDEATRIVFVDINLYNPNHNVFVMVNLYVEIPPTAGLLPRCVGKVGVAVLAVLTESDQRASSAG